MAMLIPQGKQAYTDGAGNPLAGGLLYTYAGGTSTPLATYSDQAGAIPNTNPVVLDARGEATIFWGAGPYKATLRDALDVLIWTQDDIYPPASAADLTTTSANVTTITNRLNGVAATTIGAGLITATGSTTPRTLAARFADTVNVKDFGATGDGITNDTTACQAAIDSLPQTGGCVMFPAGKYRVNLKMGGGWTNTVRTVELVGQNPSWQNGTNNGATLIGVTSDPVIDVFGLYQGHIKGVNIDLAGVSTIGLRIRSVNPYRSVDGTVENVFIWDSTYGNTGLGVQVGDSTVNQVSEWKFRNVHTHSSLLNAVSQAGDNTVDITWSHALLSSHEHTYLIAGGCEVTFDGHSQFMVATSGYSCVKVSAAAGTNNPAINVIPGRISFINAYWEMGAMQYLVDFAGVSPTGLPADSGAATEYPGRTIIEIVGGHVWCSTPRTLVNFETGVPADLVITGGRYHNITQWAGGMAAAVQTTHNVVLLHPVYTGPNIATIFDRSYGQPVSVTRGVARFKEMYLSNPSGYDRAKFTNEDGGGFDFNKPGDSMWRIGSSSDSNLTSYGNGVWDDPHIVLGGRHIWIDGSGNLRWKNGAPTSAGDGVVLGANAAP